MMKLPQDQSDHVDRSHRPRINRLSSNSWKGGLAATLMAVIFASVLPTRLEAETPASIAPTMRRLAKVGEFSRLQALLKGYDTDTNVQRLLADISAYSKHQKDHATVRREAYDKAFANMKKLAVENKLLEALYASIESNGLADDAKAMLQLQPVVDLVNKANKTAEKAQVDHDWLEALSLYRAIELLFDDRGMYDKQVSRVERHLRLLRFYAPDELDKLYQLRFDRLKKQAQSDKKDGTDSEDDEADEPDEPIKVTREAWQQRLKGIQMSMLRQTLSRAAHHHISNPGYTPLLKGGVHALSVMAETPGLGKAFTKFNDAKKVAAFKEGLQKLANNLNNLKQPINYLEASDYIEKISTLNTVTVELPEAVLVYEMTDGATSQLDDFTSIIWPHDLEQFARNVDGKFYGVGIQISSRGNRLTVVSPLEGTPAHAAGIIAGDVIAKVNGVPTDDWTLDKAVREITGPENTNVKLGIERAGQGKLKEFTIKRAEIVIESVKGWDHKPGGGWDYYVDRKSKIGYVRLTQFIPQTKEGLDDAIAEMEKLDGVNALIIDLRGNPGGLLSSAIDISDRFVGNGTIVSTVNSTGKETRRYTANAGRTLKNMPLAILVNQGSASASEIVSGAMQDYQRGLIVGTRSFGKGSVQDLYPIDGRSAALKLTTQYYRLPAGRIIHRKPGGKIWGIEPDVAVKMTMTQVADLIKFRQDIDVIRDGAGNDKDGKPLVASRILTEGKDPQLSAAVLILKTELLADEIAVAKGNGN